MGSGRTGEDMDGDANSSDGNESLSCCCSTCGTGPIQQTGLASSRGSKSTCNNHCSNIKSMAAEDDDDYEFPEAVNITDSHVGLNSLRIKQQIGEEAESSNSVKVLANVNSRHWEGPIADLPDDCLGLVFRHLDQLDLARCSLVCKRWHSVDSSSRSHIVLRASESMSPFLSSICYRFSGLSKIVLKGERGQQSMDDSALQILASHCPLLRKLKLKYCKQMTDAGLAAFALSCPKLIKLSCGSCGFGIAGIRSLLQTCVKLEDLTVKRPLKGPEKRDSSEPLVAPACTNLRRLCLKDQSATRMWSSVISASSKLETLILARNTSNWDIVICAAVENSSFSNLTQMYIERVELSDIGLRALAQCTALEALVVLHTPACTDAGLSALARGCISLKRLHLESWAIHHIADEGLKALALNCKKLQELVLVGHNVSVDGLQVLSTESTLLERLTLCNNPRMGDREVACLAGGCPSLKRLCIKGSPDVTDVGVLALATGCPALRKLKIRRCSSITSDSVSYLQIHRPEVQIQLESRSSATLARLEPRGLAVAGEWPQNEVILELDNGADSEAADPVATRAAVTSSRSPLSRARQVWLAGRSFVTGSFRRLVHVSDKGRDYNSGPSGH